MRKVILLVSCLLMACMAFAIKPPKAVKESFEAKYAMATNVSWDKESMGWEANFELNEKKCAAVFDETGTWLETDTEIPVNFLPPVVATAVKDKFDNANIETANKIERAGEGVQYSAKINHSGRTKEVLLSENGNLLKE